LSYFPVSNAFVERMFSFVSAQWTKERNSLSERKVKSIFQVKVNLDKNYSEMHQVVSENKALLKQTVSSTKCDWWLNTFCLAISVSFLSNFFPCCPYFLIQADGSPARLLVPRVMRLLLVVQKNKPLVCEALAIKKVV